MQVSDFRHKYMITLSDVSDHIINGKMRMDGFACHQLLLPDKSGYAISQENCEKAFSAGDVIFVGAGNLFGVRCDGDTRIRHIAFTGRRLSPLFYYCGLGEFRVIRLSEEEKDVIIRYFDQIFCFNGKPKENSAEVSAVLFSLIGKLGAIRIEADNYVYDKSSLLIRPIIDYMQKNYRHARIPYDGLLSALSITRDEMNNMFYNIFSMSSDDYYHKLRMENAKHLLFCDPNDDIAFVAKNMDYDNTSDFRSDFYNAFRMTPERFIQLYH